VALAAGFVDGLKYGDNTKAAVIRIGLMEMIEFCKRFHSGLCLCYFACCFVNIVCCVYLSMNNTADAVPGFEVL